MSTLGRMHVLRTDPGGAWRNKEVHERVSDVQIILDLHPGEMPWQASVTENTTTKIVKNTVSRIALERPDVKSTEVLSAPVLAHNEMERVRGFSPAQSALGRSPNWDPSFFDSGKETPDPSFLEHQQGVDAARETKNGCREHHARKTDRGLMSDRVTRWISGDVEKAQGAQRHIKRRFRGGEVVLATSTGVAWRSSGIWILSSYGFNNVCSRRMSHCVGLLVQGIWQTCSQSICQVQRSSRTLDGWGSARCLLGRSI